MNFLMITGRTVNQGVTVENAHRALGDCLMTLGVLRAMANGELAYNSLNEYDEIL